MPVSVIVCTPHLDCLSCHDNNARRRNKAADLQQGGEMMNVRIAITRGIEAACAAQAGNLRAAEIELLTALVVDLRRRP